MVQQESVDPPILQIGRIGIASTEIVKGNAVTQLVQTLQLVLHLLFFHPHSFGQLKYNGGGGNLVLIEQWTDKIDKLHVGRDPRRKGCW